MLPAPVEAKVYSGVESLVVVAIAVTSYMASVVV